MKCPDCGGRVEDHNAVNRVPNGVIAHSAYGGACWKALNTPFVEALQTYLQEKHGNEGERTVKEAMNEACKMLGVKTAEEMVAKLAQVMIAGDTMATQLEIVARDLRSVVPPTEAWTALIDAAERQARYGRRFFPEVKP